MIPGSLTGPVKNEEGNMAGLLLSGCPQRNCVIVP
jgi:hypothetical protein